LLAFVRGFLATVEKISDVRVFLGLGDAHLFHAGCGDGFAQGHVEALRSEDGLAWIFLIVNCECDVVDIWHGTTFESVKVFLEKRF